MLAHVRAPAFVIDALVVPPYVAEKPLAPVTVIFDHVRPTPDILPVDDILAPLIAPIDDILEPRIAPACVIAALTPCACSNRDTYSSS